LKTEEIRETKGGWYWLPQGLAVRFLYEVAADWDVNVKAFNDSRNRAIN
jgi:hypothetical protein